MITKPRGPVLMLLSAPARETAVLEYGTAIARARGLPARVLAAASAEALGNTIATGGLAAVRTQGPPDPGVSLVVSELNPASSAFGALIRATHEWRVPSVYVRGDGGSIVASKRVLVATAGGHHALQQMAVAYDLSRALGVPVQWLRVRCRDDGAGDSAASVADVQRRFLGLATPVCLTQGPDPVAGILAHVRPRDLILVGTPNVWRAAVHFGGSVPDLLCRHVSNPVAMVSAPAPLALTVRDILWESLIRTNLRVQDGRAAMAALVDTLVARYQIPPSHRDEALQRALAREAELPTAVGCETAFPHAAIPGFRGVLCCLGICPDGVVFGSENGEPVRFLFLMVTPKEVYDEYLVVLGLLARRIVLPAVRAGLAACRTAREALDLLAPAMSRPALLQRPCRLDVEADRPAAQPLQAQTATEG